MSIAETLDPLIDVPALPARERILATAYRLFYREGIRATGIDKVIAEAGGVTKVTFYRHFPSKDALILAYLELRHQRWMDWFVDSLDRHAGNRRRPPVVSAVEEWLTADSFRGCAFINGVNEIGADLPEVHAMTTRHKADMVTAIKETLPPGANRTRTAQALGVALDGAVVHAQYQRNATSAVKALATIASALLSADT